MDVSEYSHTIRIFTYPISRQQLFIRSVFYLRLEPDYRCGMKPDAKHDSIELLRQLLSIYPSQASLAEALETTQATVSRWMTKGTKRADIRLEFRLKIIDLAEKNGLISAEQAKRPALDRYSVAEIDLTAGLGGGGLVLSEASTSNGITYSKEMIRDYWRFPAWVFAALGVPAEAVAGFPVQGDSMLPTLLNGDVVFIDKRHRVPSPPGIYALLDDFGGVIVKRLEVISARGAEPRILVSSDNDRHQAYERGVEEIYIVGRYIGKFTW